MNCECKRKKSIYLAVLTLIVSILFCSTACGPSYEDQQAKKEAKTKELEKHAIAQIANKHNAVYFPPNNLGAVVFTYEFQKFFKTHSQKPVLFKGYLEDIEQTKNGIIAEFLCPLGGGIFINRKGMRFRLSISEKFVEQLLRRKQEDAVLYLLRYMYGPDYYVVAKIENVGTSRMYEFTGAANGEEVEIEPDIFKKIVPTGQLIDAVPIPKN